MSHKRVAILISGGGSNMVALVDSMRDDHPARPCLVLSNRPDAGGLAKAEARGIPTAVVASKPFRGDRAAFEAALSARGPFLIDVLIDPDQASPLLKRFESLINQGNSKTVAGWDT